MREDDVNELCHKIVADNDKCFYDRLFAIASNGGEITCYGCFSEKEVYELFSAFLSKFPNLCKPTMSAIITALGEDINTFFDDVDLGDDYDDDDDE